MSRVVLGIDPDANLHGVAVFENGLLTDLRKMYLTEIMTYIQEKRREVPFLLVGMENVLHTNAVFEDKAQRNIRKHAKVSNNIGRCQQSCIELMRLFAYLDQPYQLIKPTGRDWKHNKALFEKITGWTGKSNEDTRSAAYFGWILAHPVEKAAEAGKWISVPI